MARQKLVFDTGEIAHLWIHQKQEEARNPQHNFYYEGKSIYSYGRHFKIAEIIDAKKKIVMMTSASYSSTTGKHIGNVWQAIPSDWTTIKVQTPHSTEHTSYFEGNTNAIFEEIKVLAEKQKRARSVNYFPQIKAAIINLVNYVDLIKARKRVSPAIKFLLKKDITDEEIIKGLDMANEKIAKLRVKKEKELTKKKNESIEKWLNGELPKNALTFFRIGEAKLRLVDEKVQTSLGIEVDAAEAKKLFDTIQKVVGKKMSQETIDALLESDKVTKVAGWDISRLTAEGDLIAGCHHIHYKEIQRFAKKYNWQ